jgi:GntR family transcriptional regulator
MDNGPLYLRIAGDLESEIASGLLRAGEKVSSERVLSERFGVSRMTARQALRHLGSKGLVETRTGQGTFVGSRQIEQRLETLSGFTEEMARQGRHASSVLVASGTVAADDECARALSIPASGKVHRLTRIRFVDGDPVALETTAVLAGRTPGLLDLSDFQTSSLYDTLKTRYAIVPTRAEQTLMAGVADATIARTLRMPHGAAVLSLTRLTRDQDGNAFEYVKSSYRGDFFVMKVNLSLGAATGP